MASERGNIAAPFAQGRQRDRGRADSLGEPGGKIFGKRAAVGRDHANVDRMAAVQPDRAALSGGEDPIEQLLSLKRKRGNLAENERSAVGLDELACLRC